MNGISNSYMNQRGPIKIRIINDYLFRVLMQTNQRVLKAFIAALLHLKESSITSLKIENPIVPGEYIDEKEYVLDLLVVVNGYLRLNIELQVVNQHNWSERSLLYLCRDFDRINRGDDYVDVFPAIQIGLLDFSLTKEEPEFYATYKMTNERTHRVYTDKFQLKVMELRQSALATDEDKKWNLDKWAKFFKATNWEEVNMLSKELAVFGDAGDTIWRMSADEKIRRQCEAREEYYRHQRTIERLFAEKIAEIEKKDMIISEQDAAISEKDALISKKDALISKKDAAISEKDATISEKDATISEKDATIAKMEKEIARLKQLHQ